MSDFQVQQAIQDQIEKTPVGEKVRINFSGLTAIIDVEMVFAGGWRITQNITPGRALEFIRGEDGFLQEINITINPYDGLR